MNWIDKSIGYFAPKRGLQRARARHAMRIYEGASGGRRSSSWRSRVGSSANAEIAPAITSLRDRARELERNTPHAPRMLDVFVSHVIGTGLRPIPVIGSDRLENKVMDLWNEWQAGADVEGIDSFYSLQVLAVRSMIKDGELAVRLIDRRQEDIKHSPVPFQLQLLEGDFIDHLRDAITSIPPAGNGTLRTRLGVGLGKYDVRTGLWLYPFHPGDMITTQAMKAMISEFVPMDNLIHLFRRVRPGQVRGVSWFAPMLTTARAFADFMDAVTVKARVEACFSAFVEQPDELQAVIEPDATTGRAVDLYGPDVATLQPGLIQQLKPGQKISFAQPSSTSQVEAVMMFDLMAMAASVGVTYDQLSGDLRQANYSSLRAGKLDFNRLVEQTQELIVIPRLCKPIWDRFINRAVLSGALTERRGGYPCDWVTPAFESVNPKFDQDAEERSVRAGRTTPQEFIASWGGNWRKVLRDTAEFYKLADELGVVLDIDVRKTSRAGQFQPPTKKPGEAGAGAPADNPKKPNGGDDGAEETPPQPVMLVDENGDPINLDDLANAQQAN